MNNFHSSTYNHTYNSKGKKKPTVFKSKLICYYIFQATQKIMSIRYFKNQKIKATRIKFTCSHLP